MLRFLTTLRGVLRRVVPLVAVTALVLGWCASAAHAAAHKKTPTPTITQKPPAQTNVRSATLGFADAASGAKFTCSLDARAFSACSSPTTYPGPLSAGAHTFRVRATVTGRTVSAAARVSWTIDLTAPPAPTLSGIPSPSPTAQTGATLSFADAERGVTMLCALDSATPAACTSPLTLSGLSDGPHRFAVAARDAAGNVSVSAAGSWEVDSTPPPVPVITTGPADPTNQTSATFLVADADPSALLSCSLDGAAYAPCGPSASYAALASGPHTFDLRATDEVGNHSNAPQFAWTVDLTAPTPPTIYNGPAAITNQSVGSFTFSLPAGATQLRCSLDGAAYADCASPYSTPALPDGAHSLLVRARDAAMNESGATPFHWTIDTVSPTAAITTTTSLTGSVQVRFSEPVQGVSTSSLQLRVVHSSTARPASVSCRSADALAVSCSTGPVAAATLRLQGSLLPGQTYVAVADPSGEATITDPAGNRVAATSKQFRAQTRIQENSVGTAYSWRLVHAAAAFGSSYRTEHAAGASVTYRFTGVGITWYTRTGPSEGLADVYVDGVKKAAVDNYAATTTYRVARSISGLPNRVHTLRILVAGRKGNALGKGTFVAVDAMRVSGHAVVATPKLTSRWRIASSRSASGRAFAVSDLQGATTSLRFKGTSIAWYTSTGRNRGIAKVYLDGMLRATYDLYRSSTAWGVRRMLGSLRNAVHTVQVLVTGRHRRGATGSQVLLDRWVVG